MLLDKKLLEKAGRFGFISGELLVTIGGGFYLGQYLDQKWGLSSKFSVLLPVLGLVYSVWRILQISKKWFRDDANSDIAKNKD